MEKQRGAPMGHSWSCPICEQLFRRESDAMQTTLGDFASKTLARQALQWDAINHLATHISDSLSQTKIEEES